MSPVGRSRVTRCGSAPPQGRRVRRPYVVRPARGDVRSPAHRSALCTSDVGAVVWVGSLRRIADAEPARVHFGDALGALIG